MANGFDGDYAGPIRRCSVRAEFENTDNGQSFCEWFEWQSKGQKVVASGCGCVQRNGHAAAHSISSDGRREISLQWDCIHEGKFSL